MSNFKSASAGVSLELAMNGNDSLASSNSACKAISGALNVTGSGSIGTSTESGSRKLADLKIDASADGILAISFVNSSSVGGKLVMSFSAKCKTTVADPTSLKSTSSLPMDYSITISMYDDSNAVEYSETWTDMSAFQAAIQNAGFITTTTGS